MALDAVFLRAVTEELRPQVTGARIEKIYQPARDQVIVLLRGNLRLLLSAGANAPRMQLTRLSRENPTEPPMFCMLLRKHLLGGRIAALTQPLLERLVRIEIDTADDFGRPGRRTLVLEAMGRRSNLILLDEEGRIIDCLRRIDADMSPARQVLPGLYYAQPPTTGRLPVTEETETGFRNKLTRADPERRIETFLLDHYFGLSPLLARELVFRTCGETDSRIFALSQLDRLWEIFRRFADEIRENRFTPVCLNRNGSPMEFACFPILQYGPATDLKQFDSFSHLLDDYYEIRERQDRIRQRGAELMRAVTTARDRLQRKLTLQEKDYAVTQNRDELRIQGDLITAHFYCMSRGQTELICENFYTGNMTVIPLDPLLTPQQNAAKYYKRYAKARTAEKYLQEQMTLAQQDLDYLESVLEELERGETEQDFMEIRRELRENGFLRVSGKGKKDRQERNNKRDKKERPTRPREARTSTGFTLLIGRNNRQNDALTRHADRRDLWFHTQKIHGAHVILRTEGQTPDPGTIAEAAAVAAYYSQARESSRVPVDYTPVRNVKKPPGARPGMVIYNTYRTVYVTPEKDRTR